jgi:2-polyprenyl-3-methyl-5-hydroxy-6-metoxy-1,4-benzoquinol methylase
MAETYIVGLDIFRGNLMFCRKYGAYDDLVLADIRKLPFRDNCIDVILACEVIEHVEKKEGEEFLKETDRVNNVRILITTPNGCRPENPIVYADGSINLYERHKSLGCKRFHNKGLYCESYWLENSATT